MALWQIEMCKGYKYLVRKYSTDRRHRSQIDDQLYRYSIVRYAIIRPGYSNGPRHDGTRTAAQVCIHVLRRATSIVH